MADERDGMMGERAPVACLFCRLCWAAVGWGGSSCLDPTRLTARQHGFAHNSLPSFRVIMAPSGTRRLNSHNCRLSLLALHRAGWYPCLIALSYSGRNGPSLLDFLHYSFLCCVLWSCCSMGRMLHPLCYTTFYPSE